MAVESNLILKRSYPAGADLSTHQYKFVKLNTSGQVVLCAATTDRPIGVLQNKPTTNVAAEVVVIGQTKVITAAATTTSSVGGTDANGLFAIYAAGTDTTKYLVGICDYPTGGASEVGSIIVNCASAARGA